MSEPEKGARPSQVTMAGWIAFTSSVLIVLTLFESVGRLRTVQFRDEIDEFLSTPPGSGLGLDIPQVVEILHWLMLLSGAAAAAAMVLAIFVLQRNNGARIGFTVAAIAIMLTAPVAGGFLPVFIAFAAFMLWTKPARAWFAGEPVPAGDGAGGLGAFGARHDRSRARGTTVSSEDHPSQDQPDAPRPGGEAPSWPRMPEDASGRPVPPPTHGYGSAGAAGSGGPQQGPGGAHGQGTEGSQGQGGSPYGPPGGWRPEQGRPPYGQGYPPPPYAQTGPYGAQQPYGGQPPYGGPPPYGYPSPYGQQSYPPQYYGQQRPSDPDQRPATVTVAAWITWALAGITLLGFLLLGLVMVAARDDFIRQLERDASFRQLDLPTDQMIAAMWGMGAVVLFWCVCAMVLAWLAYRRANWARITLVVSAAMALLFSLAAFPVGLLHTLGAGAVIALLFLGGANDWYAGRSDSQGFPGPFPPYGQQQYGAPAGGGSPGQYGPGQYGQGSSYPGQPGQQAQPSQEQPSQGQPSSGQAASGQADVPDGAGREQGYGEQPPADGQGAGDSRSGRKDEPPSNVW